MANDRIPSDMIINRTTGTKVSDEIGILLNSKNGYINVKEQFGAIGDGLSHPLSEKYATLSAAQVKYPHATALTQQIDWAAIQGAINYAKANKYRRVFIPDGDYVFGTDSLKGNGSDVSTDFKGVSIIGTGFDSVSFNYPSYGDQACINYMGGSGTLTGIVVEGIYFKGSSLSTAIQCNSQGWVTAYRCRFGLNQTGMLFSNNSAGGFTEYCKAEESLFDTDCKQPTYYYRGAGNDSFHGSGLEKCLINLAANNSVATIGAGALVYNAPMDFQVWGNSTNTIIKNDSTNPVMAHGTITTEGEVTVGGGTGAEIILMGDIVGMTSVKLGTCKANNKLVKHGSEAGSANGVISTWVQPYAKKYTLASTAVSTITTSGSAQVIVNIQATNYDYRYLLQVTHDGTGGTGFVNILATIKTFDSIAVGAPTFSVNTSGVLSISNANYTSSFVADIYVTPMTTNSPTDRW